MISTSFTPAITRWKSKAVEFPSWTSARNGCEPPSIMPAGISQRVWSLCEAFISRARGLSATVHFRQAPGELNSWIETTVRTILGGLPELSVRPAREALDILPRTVWTKGSVIKLLVKQTRAARAAVICAGDDTTDEDMFDAVPGAISIRVGSVQVTRARYYLSGPLELLRFLKWLGPDKAAIGELPSMATKESTPTRRRPT